MRSVPRRGLSDADRRVIELQLWVISSGASCCIVDMQPYEACRVAGVVERLTLNPAAGCVEASITDGTHRVLARWAIQRPSPHVACVPGRRVMIEGMPVPGDDCFLMFEPRFEVTVPVKVA